jgi:hypothetical protein
MPGVVTLASDGRNLVVRQAKDAGRYEKLAWREAHRALQRAEESGWWSVDELERQLDERRNHLAA